MTDVVKTEATEIATRKPIASPEGVELGQLLRAAVEKDISVESLEKLVALYERMADRQASQEFSDALAAFQQECPPVPRTALGEIKTQRGGTFQWTYAPLDTIAATVRPILHKHGLSFTWDTEITENRLRMACWVRHRNGHREKAGITVPIESPSPNMSEHHKHSATFKLCQRLTLIAALGLTDADEDKDERDPRPISEDQAIRLQEAMEDVHLSKARLLKLLGHGIERIEEMPDFLYETAMNLITMKRRQQDAARGES